MIVLTGYQSMMLLRQGPYEVKSYLLSSSKFMGLISAFVHMPIYFGWFCKYHSLWHLFSKQCTVNWNAIIFVNYCLILAATLISTLIIATGLILLWLILPLAIEILLEGKLETQD